MSNDAGKADVPFCILRVRQGDRDVAAYQVTQFPCRIGRAETCDIAICEPSVSTLHAVLALLPNNQIQIEDQWSTNGISLEGRRVTQVLVDRPLQMRLGRVDVDLEPGGTAFQAELGAVAPVAAGPQPEKKPGKCLYRHEGREYGPFTREQMEALAREGKLLKTDLVWIPDSMSWLQAQCVPGLFQRSPPPATTTVKPDLGAGQPEQTVAVQAPAVAAGQAEGTAALSATSVEPATPVPVPPEPVRPAELVRVKPRVREITDEKPATEPVVRIRKEKETPKKDGETRDTQTRRALARRGIVCPHCWHRFDVEEFLFVARHQSLIGDPVLGADAQQRFLPSRFTPEGHALDSMGMACPDMACPRCHLRIPQPASEMPPLFLSIVGATASGKSYFLTSMTWDLRNTLSKNFAVSFTDTDAINNQILNDFEETLFLNSDPEQIVALRKTELQGELYNQILLDGMLINLPKPFMFSVTPAEHHPDYAQAKEKMSRTLVLYDNAGEHFEPGMDSVVNPTTQHLLHSDAIFFLFDPTKDVRFRRLLKADDPQLAKGARVQRQEIILTEMINRIRKYSGMRAGAKTGKLLMVIVSKADVWLDRLKMDLPEAPWRWEAKWNSCGVDMELIRTVSYSVRCLLEEVCPEVVTTAESFAGDVLYLPNSALGHSPKLNPDSGMIGIQPGDIEPFWVSAPMLYFFCQRGFIPAQPRTRKRGVDTVAAEFKVSGDVVFVSLPGLEKPLQVPLFYTGARLRCPKTGAWFDMPVRRK